MPSLQQIDSLLAGEPNDLFLNFARAMELMRLGRVDDSAAQFDRVITLNSEYCPAYFQKGRAFAGAGRIAEAKAALQAGIETARRTGDDHAAGEMGDLLESL